MLAGNRVLPNPGWNAGGSANDALLRFESFGCFYYSEMRAIGTHAALRKLWIEEGERRGYELS